MSLSLAAGSIEVGETSTATAKALDQFGAEVVAGPVTFASATPQIAAISPTTGQIFGIAPGTAEITATVEGKSDQRTVTVVKAPILINEIKPNVPGEPGWVELFNPTAATIDVSNWIITAGDILRSFTLPAGSEITARGYFVVGGIPAGLQAVDGVHLFSRFGVQVDSYNWSVNTAASYGRCPNGAGPFQVTTVVTQATANVCP